MLEPEQVMDDWLKDEEWNQEKMRSLEKTINGSSPSLRLSYRSNTPFSSSGLSKHNFIPEICEYGMKLFFNNFDIFFSRY